MSDVAKTPREELECKKKYLYEHSMFWECNDGFKSQILEDDVVDLLNELHDENQLLKCALALDAITNISLNDKKVDIPPYYEFENYQQLKKERREEYDEYW